MIREDHNVPEDPNILHLINQLAAQSAKQEEQIDSLRGMVKTVAESVNKLSQRIDERTKPQWQTYIAGGTFLLILAAAFGSGWVRDLNRMSAELRDHVGMKGHPAAIATMQHNDENSVLRHEGQNTRINGLEKHLIDRIDKMEGDIEDLERSLLNGTNTTER